MNTRSKVLLMTNDSRLKQFVVDALSERSHQLVHAHCGADTDSLLRGESPDLIVLDIMMPRLEGLEVALRFRRQTDTPILMVSTWGTAAGQARSLDLASESYLSPPFDGDAFREHVRTALRRASSGGSSPSGGRLSLGKPLPGWHAPGGAAPTP